MINPKATRKKGQLYRKKNVQNACDSTQTQAKVICGKKVTIMPNANFFMSQNLTIPAVEQAQEPVLHLK